MTRPTLGRSRASARPLGRWRGRRWVAIVIAAGAAALSAGAITVLAGSALSPTRGDGAFPGGIPSGIPSAKAALQQQVDSQGKGSALSGSAAASAKAAALLHPPAIPSFAPPTRIRGIQKTNQGPFPPSTFLVRDFWEAPIGSTWYLVYAGGRPDNPASSDSISQGSVALYTQGSDPNTPPVFQGFYPAPASSGALTITAASGQVLTLQSANGQIFTFDVVTHAYA